MKTASHTAISGIGETLDRLCEDLLGWTFPPAPRAMLDAGWSPDDPNAAVYCRRCGDSVGPGEATDTGCGTCREGGELAGGLGDGVVRLGPYLDDLRHWVLLAKYRCWNEMGHALGETLGRQFLQANAVDPKRTIIVPMPMHWLRRWHRGTDHAAVLATGVASVVQVPIMNVLAKRLDSPQVGLTMSERKRVGGRALHVRKRLGGWDLRGMHVVIVDDVRTTGATLKAATRLVRSLKPERVMCAVIAVSDAKSRRTRHEQITSKSGELIQA